MSDPGPCPTDDDLLAFVHGRLDEAARRKIDEHIAGCADCSAFVAEAARYPTMVPATGDSRRARRRRLAAAAMAAAVAVGAALLLLTARRRHVPAPEPCTGGEGAFRWEANGHCYTRHDRPLPWDEARAACERQDGELFTATSYSEVTEVGAKLGGVFQTAHWLGIREARGQAKPTTWINGELLPPPGPAWGPEDEPSDGGARCVFQEPGPLHRYAKIRLRWTLAPCSRLLPYVCKRSPWITRASTGHAYRLFPHPLSWPEARAACAAVGAHLVTLGDADEDAFVMRDVRVDVWTGGNDLDQEMTFVWDDGEKFSYTRFAPTEPDDTTGRNDCVAIGPDRLWHDRVCSYPYSYVCERD